MSLLLTARPRASGDTYLMARNHVLWPAFATASSGGVRTASTSSMWGGYHDSPNGTVGHYYEWADVVLQPGTYKISILGWKDSYCGIYSVLHGGADTGARLDMYNASNAWNQVVSATFTIATKARGALRLSMASKHASASQHFANGQQVAIEKTSADSDAGESVDDLPWLVSLPCTTNSVATSGTWTRDIHQSYPQGTILYTTGNGNWIEFDAWIPAGTWTLSATHYRSTDQGIMDVSVAGASVGTIDLYGTAGSVTGTITGISVATTATHRIRVAVNGKNASSSGYGCQFAWLQFRRTA